MSDDMNQQQQAYQAPGQAQPVYQQQYYQQPMPAVYQQAEAPITTGEWVLNLFLVAIPIVGLVLLFVWAFGSGAPASKRNWARANLIWVLVGIVVSIVLGVAFTMLGITLEQSGALNDMTRYMMYY